MGTPARLLRLLLCSLAAGAAANAVSPWGIPWIDPVGKGLRARAAAAGLVPLALADVRARLRDSSFVFIDTRPAEEFEVGSLPGARSLPWKEVEEGRPIPSWAAGRVVVFCANEFCESSLELGRRLRGQGVRDVGLFVEGYEAWWNSGGLDEPR
jgi:rhodanese-related sulfurtransferase